MKKLPVWEGRFRNTKRQLHDRIATVKDELAGRILAGEDLTEADKAYYRGRMEELENAEQCLKSIEFSSHYYD